MKCNPNGPCRVGSSIYQISYGLRHLIQQTPTWVSLITIFAYVTSGTNQQSQLSKTLLNYEAPFQISDRIILCSHDIRRKNTWNNVVLIVQQFVSRFSICLTKNLIEHINLVLTGRYIGHNKIIEGPRYRFYFQKEQINFDSYACSTTC